MFSRYYQSELAFLREMGREFGLANPSVAGMLAERGGDPDVERLLEGFAFLTARVRERLDGGVPELVQGLCQLLLPHFLRPLPAATIVEFTPQARLLRGRTRIDRGAEVASHPVDESNTGCLFQTTANVDLLPLALQEVSEDTRVASAPMIRLSFQTTEQGRAEVLRPEGIRLFLHGELPVASTMLLWLTRYLRATWVRDSTTGKGVRLPPTAIRAVGLGSELKLFPWPDRAPEGYRLLQEYFALPQKLLFLDVRELDHAMGVVGPQFEICFELDRPPPLGGRITRELFRLHCVPAINLFQTTAEPIAHRLVGEEHLIRAAGLHPTQMEVFSVDGVFSQRPGRGEREEIPPLMAFEHGRQKGPVAPFYQLRRAPSVLDEGYDTFLSLGMTSDGPPRFGDETLSLELTCTHRSLPTRLQISDLSLATGRSPTVARFRNITPVSKPLRPPLDRELHWRLLSHLACNFRSLAEAEALRGLLELYNFQAEADLPAGRANQRRIAAISHVEVTPIQQLLGGAPIRGCQTRLDLEDAQLAGPGDAFLFGAVIDELLAEHVTLNAFNALTVTLRPSGMELVFPPRSGRDLLL